MNSAAVDSIAPPGPGLAGDPAARRWYAGQSASQQTAGAYTALLPADDEWSRDTVLRAVVADALQRNGLTVDEDTLEATVESFAAPGGALADTALTWKLRPGETRADARIAPPFHGYEVAMPVNLQTSLVDYAKQWSAHRDTQPPAPVDRPLSELKQLAIAGGHGDVAETLAALEAAIKAGSAAQRGGQPLDAVALSAVLEFAGRTGRERDAARILERYSAIKGVVGDAKDLGHNAGRVFNGRDPLTGKALNADQRVDSAFDLLSGGFKLAGGIGNAAVLLGARNVGLVGALIGVAPAGVAIVAFAAGAFELIKRAREAILAPQWNEFRERFPFAEGLEPKRAISSVMRQIAGMPTDGDNALSTATRIIAGIGQNPETRERFLAFLKTKIQPESMVDALGSGAGLDELSIQKRIFMAEAAKNSAKEFLDLELKDVKRYVHDRDGVRERGTYLLSGAAQDAANRNNNKLGGAVEEGLRLAGILTSSANALNGQYRDLLDKVKGNGELPKLNDQQQKNLAAALIPASREGGLTQVDHLVASKDGSRLFAVQGDLDSPTRRMVALDVAAGSQQSVETSSKLAAHHAANAATQEQAQLSQNGGRGL